MYEWPNNWKFSPCQGIRDRGLHCDLLEGETNARVCMLCEWLWTTGSEIRRLGSDNARAVLKTCDTQGFRQAFKEYYMLQLTNGGD